MTKKDYVKLAAALLRARPPMSTEQERAVYTHAVRAVADVCQEDSPRFDRERFLKAALEG